MSATSPTRIDGDLFESAKTIGELSSRSAAQQINHWARIGREFESSPSTRLSEIQRVLAGDTGASYDDLNNFEQAIVRASWEERAESLRSKLNFAKEFTHDGSTYSEADATGAVTVHPGNGTNSD